MNHLPSTPIATRLNALIAAVAVTLTLLSGIDAMALSQGVAPLMAQATSTAAA